MKQAVILYNDKGSSNEIDGLGLPLDQAIQTLAYAYMQDLELGVSVPCHVHIDLDRELYIFGGGPDLDPKQIKL